MKSIEMCIEGILQEIVKRRDVDFGDKASVRRFNAAYDKSFAYMKYIDKHYPDQLDKVMNLLKSDEADVVGHCAPMILRLEHSTENQKQTAIQAIRDLLRDPRVSPADKLGFSMLIGEWHPKTESHMTAKYRTD